MDIYGGFAQIYDMFMEDAPYDEWVDYIEKIWKKFDLSPKLVLDLACGTGTVTHILSQKGYDMIGIDISEDMLDVARRKSPHVLFLQQDMREFELYGTVDAIICICDGINYITENEDLTKVFSLVRNYLNPGGLFIFDINTEYKFNQILSENTFAAAGSDAAYIWENYYDKDEKINEYAMTFFVKSGQGYMRFDETHIQKAHSPKDIEASLAAADLKLLVQYDELTCDMPRPDSSRIFFVAKNSV